MSLPKVLNSFRGKLIIGLVIPVIIILGFDFYIFSKGRQFETLLQTKPLTQDKIQVLEKGIQNFSRISFFFLSLVIIFNLGIVITLVVILTFALQMILNGIKRIEGGDLSFRIPLRSQDEFGTIAQFLNSATAKVEITQRSIEQKVIERTHQLTLAVNQLNADKTTISAERNKLAVTISGITDAVIAVNLERKIIIFNSAAEKLTGYFAKEALGRPLDQVIRIFDKDLEITPTNYCPIGSDVMEGVGFIKPNLRLVSKKEAYVNLIAGQIAEGKENNLGCILTMHDVSEERELERMKLDFVAMAVHELRTPLTAIKGYLQIYLRDYKTSLNEKQTTILQRVNISTQKLVTLIENLLNISRIERGSLSINLQPVDWAAVVKSVVGEISEQAKDKNIELTYEFPLQILPKVSVDPLRINEVLSNLLSNAVTYTSPGGEVKVWVERKEGEVITHVSDTGQGIPAESLPHLFTKFFRVSGPLEQGSKGTGLGLYIAKSIVDMHHGKIWAESKLGEGATFSFTLPIYMEETLPQ